MPKSDFSVRISILIFIAIDIVEMLEIIGIGFFINIEIMLAFFKNLNFVLFEHDYINTSRSLKGFIVKVEVIMKLDSQHETGDKHTMHVKAIQRETLKINVPIHNYNRYDKTFRGEPCEFMQPSEVVLNGDIRGFFRVEDGGG